MTYTKLENINNVVAQLEAGIIASSITILLQTGQGSQFGVDFPMKGTLVKREMIGGNSVVTKREIVLITARTADTLTITRGHEVCIQNDTIQPPIQSATPLSFSANDYIEHTLTAGDIQGFKDEFDRVVDPITSDFVLKGAVDQSIGGIKTFTSVTKGISPVDTEDLTTRGYVDDAIFSSQGQQELVFQNMIAGETILDKELCFIDKFDLGNTFQSNLGDNVGRLRGSISIFGSGVSTNTIPIFVGKSGSPSLNFGARIETDNAGKPSGVLLNLDSDYNINIVPGTIPGAVSSFNLVFGKDIDLPYGQKAHLVFYVGPYGDETANASNFYLLRFHSRLSRVYKSHYFDGTVRNDFVDISGAGSNLPPTYTTTISQISRVGQTFIAKDTFTLSGATGTNTGTSGNANFRVIHSAGTTNGTQSFGVGTITPIVINKGTSFSVEFFYNVSTAINMTSNTNNLERDNVIYSTKVVFGENRIQMISVLNISLVTRVGIISQSSIGLSKTVVSKTQANDILLLPGTNEQPLFAKGNSADGLVDCVFMGLFSNGSLIPFTNYFAGNTAGSIQTTAGSNIYLIGKSLDNNNILIFNKNIG